MDRRREAEDYGEILANNEKDKWGHPPCRRPVFFDFEIFVKLVHAELKM